MGINLHLLKNDLEDPRNAFLYCKHVRSGRVYSLEKIIAKSSRYSHLYSREVLKDRFPLAEKSCFTKPWSDIDTSKYIYYIFEIGKINELYLMEKDLFKSSLNTVVYSILSNKLRNKQGEVTLLTDKTNRGIICKNYYMEYLDMKGKSLGSQPRSLYILKMLRALKIDIPIWNYNERINI
jgi:hypothetical protein